MKTLRGPLLTLGLLLPLLTAANAGAQEQQVARDAGQLYATREYLTAMLEKFDSDARSTGYSDLVRAIARDEADLIRMRLRDGDFEVGDQITVTVAGQANLTGKQYKVETGRMLHIPELGASMSLQGLLRSELQDSLTAFMGRYFRNPQVYVQTSIRLQVFGEVGNPGFHDVQADIRLTDVLSQVGQPSGSAKLEDMTVKRANETIWDGDALQQAIIEGRTIDQMSLRAGDRIDVPAQKSRNLGQVIRDLYFLVPVSLAIMRIF